eukprot:TRINITY_DN6939_c0_g1_i1.p1 TRINITY_DN6939_c0_g1~~TRINITY_DN6939_c0_g1_i1.p1  ORF type:complete len:534 (+),score=94.37 TRINITY_DN6939_c0_g1_i1:191-1603(+)
MSLSKTPTSPSQLVMPATPILKTAERPGEDRGQAPGSAKKAVRTRTRDDFEFGRVLGEGAFGQVVLATEKSSGNKYAIKMVEKMHVIKEKKTETVKREKAILDILVHPFVVRLYYTFQDETTLYFVIELAEHGELLDLLRSMITLDLESVKFYMAEVLEAVEFVHSKNVLHRDLKPENILIGEGRHVKLTDFGTAKLIEGVSRSVSFVGTADYVSPEVLGSKSAVKASDIWALGCVLYQLIASRPPFKSANEYMTFQKILKRELTYPPGFPDDARDLVDKMLDAEPDNRPDIPAIRAHPFFGGFDFTNLSSRTPPEPSSFAPTLPYAKELAAQQQNPLAALAEREQRLEKIASQRSTEWAPFLSGSELIVRVGRLLKKDGLFARRRVLIVTDAPRFINIDAEKMVLKSEIPFQADTHADAKGKTNGRVFTLHSGPKTILFEDPDAATAGEWVDAINKLVAQKFPPKPSQS